MPRWTLALPLLGLLSSCALSPLPGGEDASPGLLDASPGILDTDAGDAGDADAAQVDTAFPLPDAGTPPLDTGAPPDATACTCRGVSTCCDGCQAVRVGQACIDDLSCTFDERCSPAGACEGENACTIPGHDCERASCDELLGCSYADLPEGAPCDDGRPGNPRDVCRAGDCIGLDCECDGVTSCCDGCHPMREGEVCSDDDARTYDDHCQTGVCVAAPCGCSPGDGPCCDGCRLLGPEKVCDTTAQPARCLADTCAGILQPTVLLRHCSGQSAACAGDLVPEAEVVEPCRSRRGCVLRDGVPACVFDNDCQ
jgi:hypothetical protein